jgi:hypothetical protein
MSALLRLLAGVTASLIALVAMLKGSGNRLVKDPDRGSCYGREPGSCRYLQAAATTRAGFLPVQHFFLLRTKLSRKDSMALSEIRTKIVGGRGASVRHGFCGTSACRSAERDKAETYLLPRSREAILVG